MKQEDFESAVQKQFGRSEGDYLIRCADFGDLIGEKEKRSDAVDALRACIEEHEQLDEVLEDVKNTVELMPTQFYGVIGKRLEWPLWIDGERIIHDVRFMSDAGGVSVGDEGVSVIIPNGYGDGDTFVYVVERGGFNDSMASPVTSIEGDFYIWQDWETFHDAVVCENAPSSKKPLELHGRYFIYRYPTLRERVIVFEKQN